MNDQKITIALNVSRARLTVIGFILTIDIFALGIFLSGMDRHVSIQIVTELNMFFSIVASLTIGTVAASLMLISERFDPIGNSEVVIFAFGEMTMYVAIVQTTSAICKAFVLLFHTSLSESVAGTLGVVSTDALLQAADFFRSIVFWMIALTWIFIAYVGPLWSLCRIPDTRPRKYLYFGYYLLMTGIVFAASAHALQIEIFARGESVGILNLFMHSFWAPSMWVEIISAR